MERSSSLRQPKADLGFTGRQAVANLHSPLRLPYAARTLADLVILRAHLSSLRRSGRGFRIDEHLLEDSVRRRIEEASTTYARACGCGLAGATAVVSLIGGWAWAMTTQFNDGFQWKDLLAFMAVPPSALILSAAVKALAISWSRYGLARQIDRALAVASNAKGDL